MDVGTQWGWWRRKILTGPIYPPTLILVEQISNPWKGIGWSSDEKTMKTEQTCILLLQKQIDWNRKKQMQGSENNGVSLEGGGRCAVLPNKKLNEKLNVFKIIVLK